MGAWVAIRVRAWVTRSTSGTGGILEAANDLAEFLDIVARDGGLGLIAEFGELLLLGGIDLLALFGEDGIDLIDIGLGLVDDFDVGFALFIGGLVLLGFLDHPIDIGLGKPVGSGDGDILGELGVEVFRGDFDDAVNIDIEGDFDAGLSATGRFDAGKGVRLGRP